jgi:hypothetical protein
LVPGLFRWALSRAPATMGAAAMTP